MKKVLIIEDEPGFQKILKEAFEKANFEVILRLLLARATTLPNFSV